MRRWLSVLGICSALSLSGLAFAQEHGADISRGELPAAAEPAHGSEAQDEHEHAPTFDDFNWYYGVFGEREGVEPDLWFRPKGMPVPFAAFVFDTLLLYGLLYAVAKKPVREGLRKRKDNILRGMDEAAKMRREAEGQLKFYEEKLAKIDDDIEHIRREMRVAAESESSRILVEAKERRIRMERDAHHLVEQELKAVRETLSAEVIAGAMRSAEQRLREQISDADQMRLGEEYLAEIPAAAGVLRVRP